MNIVFDWYNIFQYVIAAKSFILTYIYDTYDIYGSVVSEKERYVAKELLAKYQ